MLSNEHVRTLQSEVDVIADVLLAKQLSEAVALQDGLDLLVDA